MADLNPLYDQSTDNQEIAGDVQEMLNKPQAGGKLSDEDRAFLDKLMKLVEDGTINLYQPGTLLNTAVYDGLPTELKGKADVHAMTMLAKIRVIVDLERAPMDTNLQEENLVAALRLSKEEIETEHGDVFII